MNLPDDTQRLFIVGSTGTGKTQAGVWHLSQRSWDWMPWIVFDYKHDPLLSEIPHKKIDLSKVPEEPGLYLVQPLPDVDIGAVQSFLWQIHGHNNVGLYIDEGYMICDPRRPNPAFRAILTQGRSKHIPLIVLSQRPVWVDRFVASESEFIQVFWLRDKRDRDSLSSFASADLEQRLPDYHSFYHDVGADRTVVMKPVPTKSELLQIYRRRVADIEKAKTEMRPRVVAV